MSGGRSNQKARTRHAIVRAAGMLLARGEKPSLDEIAAEAKVSRATAYRYFPGLDALLSEALVDLMVPEAADLFDSDMEQDPLDRVRRVDDMFDAACRQQEAPLRLMLAKTLERSVGRAPADPPLRQNRRQPLIEAALAPIAGQLGQARLTRLAQALSLVIGTEGFIALNDVLRLNETEARKIRRWAISALIAAALSEDPASA